MSGESAGAIRRSSLLPYPKYTPIGDDWVEKIPSHWRRERLKNIATIQTSNVDKKSVDGEFPVRLCNYVDVYYNDTIDADMAFMNATATPGEIREFSLRVDDVLITKDSESWDDIAVPAHVRAAESDVLCGYHLAQIRPREGELSGAFLARAFTAAGLRDQFRVAATGITRYGLSRRWIDNAEFPLPPLPEQMAIAEFLDRETGKIDRLVAKKEELIKLLQEKRTALITHVVTKGLDPHAPVKDSGIEWLGEIPAHWRTTRLKFETSHVVDCLHSTPQYVDDGDYAAIRTADVTSGRLHVAGARRVCEEEYRERTKRLVPIEDDVFYSREGERFGIAALVPAGVQLCLAQRMMHFRAGAQLDPSYLMWALNSDGTYSQASLDTAGATSPHINVETIRNFQLPVPPRVEQAEIVEHISNETGVYDRTEEAVADGIARLQELRTALISAAVTGKIDVREEVA